MRPVLIQIGEFAIPSYGFMLVVSFIAAIIFVRRASKKFNISTDTIDSLAFYLMLGVIVGGRILYVIFHWSQYAHDVLGIIRIWEGGMMFFGGFLGALVASVIFLRKHQLPVLQIGDLIAPAIGLGEFFTRIGCFLNGCCFGTPSALPWALQFPDECVAGNSPVAQFRLHPTQLYASLFGLMLFFFLRNRLYKKHNTGEIFALYLVFSGMFRFGIDFIRFYEDSANLWVNQIIALGTAIAGAIIYLKTRQKSN